MIIFVTGLWLDLYVKHETLQLSFLQLSYGYTNVTLITQDYQLLSSEIFNYSIRLYLYYINSITYFFPSAVYGEHTNFDPTNSKKDCVSMSFIKMMSKNFNDSKCIIRVQLEN